MYSEMPAIAQGVQSEGTLPRLSLTVAENGEFYSFSFDIFFEGGSCVLFIVESLRRSASAASP